MEITKGGRRQQVGQEEADRDDRRKRRGLKKTGKVDRRKERRRLKKTGGVNRRKGKKETEKK